MRGGRIVIGAVCLLLAAGAACAQVDVDIGFKRTLYMIYEPMICKVTITNRSGRTLTLSDQPRHRWFSFQIETLDGRPLPPINSEYRNEPVEIEDGRRLTRQINLTPLFPLSEFGSYRVQAAVYVPEFGRYFRSGNLNVEITEGRKLWSHPVGVPPGAGAGRSREYTLLAHRLPETTMLYVRVEDKENGVIYCTSQLGRTVSFGSPETLIDRVNNLHILHNAAPKVYLHTIVDINGRVLKQQAYRTEKTRPALTQRSDGEIAVLGAVAYDARATAPEKSLPKLSDRPVALPGVKPTPTPDEKRPENLLSR